MFRLKSVRIWLSFFGWAGLFWAASCSSSQSETLPTDPEAKWSQIEARRRPKQILSPVEIQNRLTAYRTHVAAVSFFPKDDSIFIHVIHRKKIFYIASAVYDSLRYDISQVNKYLSTHAPAQIEPFLLSSERLYKCLISPIYEEINGYECLIVADDYLSELPFGVLAPPAVRGSQDWTQVAFWGDDFTHSYGFSVSEGVAHVSQPMKGSGCGSVPGDTLNYYFMKNDLDTVPTGKVRAFSRSDESGTLSPAEVLWITGDLNREKVSADVRYQVVAPKALFENKNTFITDFMKYFHEFQSAPYAFRNAQQNCIGHPTYGHPKYWGGYRIYGL